MQGDFQNFAAINKTRVSISVCVCLEGGVVEILVTLGQVFALAMSLTRIFQCDSPLLVNF